MAQVVRNDPFGHVLGWMLALMVAMPVAIFFFAKLEDPYPTQSWLEFAGGVTLIVLFGLALLRLRTRVLQQRLATSPRVTAELLRYTHSSPWVTFRLCYRWEDRTVERSVIVPHGKYSARLRDRSTLTLAVVPTHPKRVTIVDLYAPDTCRL